jgi:hypothetical protein
VSSFPAVQLPSGKGQLFRPLRCFDDGFDQSHAEFEGRPTLDFIIAGSNMIGHAKVHQSTLLTRLVVLLGWRT